MATDQQSMQGKTCLITGATRGVGYETALGLAHMGARVIMVGREAARTEVQAAAIRQATGNSQVEFRVADLSLMADVRRLAKEVLAIAPRLDVLINNAGAVFTRRQVTAEGIEKTFALNHLNYFLLTNLLLDRLKASGPARIVSTASAAHAGARLNFDDLQHARSYNAFAVYSESKLCNILFTYALARRLVGTEVTANCLHPGFVASGFGRNEAWYMNVAMTLLRPVMINATKGAQTSIYLASSPEVAGVSGKYFDKSRAVESSKVSQNEADAERLWEISAQLTGLAQPLAQQA